MCRSMIYVSDVQKAAAAFAQDMKENSMEDGFGGSSPRRVCSSPTPLSPASPWLEFDTAAGCGNSLTAAHALSMSWYLCTIRNEVGETCIGPLQGHQSEL